MIVRALGWAILLSIGFLYLLTCRTWLDWSATVIGVGLGVIGEEVKKRRRRKEPERRRP